MTRNSKRSSKGMSLPTIVLLGVVSSMWLLSTATLLTGSFGQVVKERTGGLMRNSAEAGLDWAVAQLNDPALRKNVDGMTVPIPSFALANPNITGSVRVTNAPAPPSSYLYDQTTDWALSKYNPQPPASAHNYILDGNGWRAVTATVSCGPFTKSIRVILKPVYATTTQSTTTAGTPIPYVVAPIATPGNYSGGAAGTISAYTSSATKPLPDPAIAASGTNKGDILANGTVSLSSATHIYGIVTSASTAPLAVAVNSTGATIGGLQANGGTNVIQNGNMMTGPVYMPNQVDGVPAQTFSAPPSPPTTAIQKTINLSGNSSMTLTAGDYVTSSIAISQNGRLVIDSTKGLINIYVAGSGSSNGITIGGNGISNPSQPGNLRIWYAGNGNVQIASNAALSGVIYAPNAPVSILGAGKFYGAVVGSSINQGSSGVIFYDNALTTSGPMYYPTTTTSSTIGQTVQNFQVISWYEF